MRAASKVPITTRALIQRINRKLRPEGQTLKVTRGRRAQCDLGKFYILNLNRNSIINHHVDPETVARKLGILEDWEAVT